MCDHINAVGGILNVSISLCLPPVLQQENVMKGALNIKDRTRNLKKEVGERKSLLSEIEELKEKKVRTSVDIDGLIKSAENLAEKAELTGNTSFVTQSNSLRRTSKEKAKELKTLGNKLEVKLQALKNY